MSEEWVVKYRGFIYVDKPSGGLPDATAVQRAAKMLKSNQKAARALHPLFARGLETSLKMTVTSSGLRVTIKDGDGEAVVMNHPIHKIAYVVDIGTCVCFIVKRPGKGKFKCHSFEAGQKSLAHAIAVQTAQLCNQLFSKVRRVSRRMRKKPAAKPKTEIVGGDEEVDTVNAAAEAGDEEVEKAIAEVNDEAEDETKAEDFSYVDGISDKLAKMVMNVEEDLPVVSDADIDLDSELFGFGEISGEADC